MDPGLAFVLLALANSSATTPDLQCSDTNDWAASVALVHLRKAGLVEDANIDFDKTDVQLLAQQQIGDDLYKQIHTVTYTLKTGATVQVVTHSNATRESCAGSSVQTFVVERVLGKKP